MEVKLINVGNSKGIIIPSKILKMLGLGSKVHLSIEEDTLVISSAPLHPREGWESLIKEETAAYGIEKNNIPDVFDDENFDDWTW